MSIEALKDQNENSIQKSLMELKKDINTPGHVNYLRENNDGKYHIYAYRLIQGGTKGGIKNKYISQIGPRIEGTQFSDSNGNEIKKEKFEAGEIVYLRVPHNIDSTPEMSTNEVISLTNKDIISLVSEVEHNREKYFNHKDKNGSYTILNGKKVYLCDDNHLPNHNGTYIRYKFDRTGELSLFTKKGNKYQGIYYNEGIRYDHKKIYKGELTFNNDKEFGVELSGK